MAAFADLQAEAGAADLAVRLGEAGVEMPLERFQDAVEPAVAGGEQRPGIIHGSMSNHQGVIH
ncbi:hypothetical protein ACH4U7_34410 [Streptomyces sp. NPDC020845]|uniref:hypothetical protein n=1 Tax=Streptomyces sp. NPDC020845 TaxID=3365096 RepID=UPI0037AA4EA6